jgi:hypothetical protein
VAKIWLTIIARLLTIIKELIWHPSISRMGLTMPHNCIDDSSSIVWRRTSSISGILARGLDAGSVLMVNQFLNKCSMYLKFTVDYGIMKGRDIFHIPPKYRPPTDKDLCFVVSSSGGESRALEMISGWDSGYTPIANCSNSIFNDGTSTWYGFVEWHYR